MNAAIFEIRKREKGNGGKAQGPSSPDHELQKQNRWLKSENKRQQAGNALLQSKASCTPAVQVLEAATMQCFLI